MPRPTPKFTQADVVRALKGAKAAGFEVGAVEISQDGRIKIMKVDAEPSTPDVTPFDAWRAGRDAH